MMQNQTLFEVCVGNNLVIVPKNKLSEFIQRNKKNVFGYWKKNKSAKPADKIRRMLYE